MEQVQLQLDGQGKGSFYITENNEQLALMEVGVNGNTLTAYHTEVSEKAEGRGFAKALLHAMVDHARTHQLQVVPLCPFVHAQFKRHPDMYADVWHAPERKL